MLPSLDARAEATRIHLSTTTRSSGRVGATQTLTSSLQMTLPASPHQECSASWSQGPTANTSFRCLGRLAQAVLSREIDSRSEACCGQSGDLRLLDPSEHHLRCCSSPSCPLHFGGRQHGGGAGDLERVRIPSEIPVEDAQCQLGGLGRVRAPRSRHRRSLCQRKHARRRADADLCCQQMAWHS